MISVDLRTINSISKSKEKRALRPNGMKISSNRVSLRSKSLSKSELISQYEEVHEPESLSVGKGVEKQENENSREEKLLGEAKEKSE